jgi:hypothetical protein
VRSADPKKKGNMQKMLQPVPGFKNVQFEEATDDEDFLVKLKEGLQGYGTKTKAEYDAILFTPAVCRAIKDDKQTTPGSTARTEGWTLEKYHEWVRNLQGPDMKIVSTTDDAQVVPILKATLDM